MNSSFRITGALAFTLLVVACERAPGADPPEVVAARQEAARNACIAHELGSRAEDNLESLELFAGAEGGAGAQGVAAAAYRFAQAYANHARLRLTAFAYGDSALNHTQTSADSARYIQAAEAIQVRAPVPETLEANAAEAYARDFEAIRTDEDHPCNWDF